MDDTKAFGTFTMHIIHTDPSPDPMDGPYLYVPEAKGVVERTYPLRSFREQVFLDNSQDTLEAGRAFLQQNGCSAFYHTSKLNLFDVKCSEQARIAYYSEIVELVHHITGCAKVFLISSVTRGGDAENIKASDKAEEAKNKEGNKKLAKDKVNLTEHEEVGKRMASVENLQPYHLPTTIKPSRIPHMDYTPLGARQLIRSMRSDVHHYADAEAGVIDYENKLCASAGNGISANKENGDEFLFQNYNKPNQPGPRYAIFSIWRPLKLCTQDPLAFVTRSDFDSACSGSDNDLEYWRYNLRTPGFKGDWCWNLAMVRAREDTDKRSEKLMAGPVWNYIPDQRPDEVLFIKHFDSASLGPNGTEVPGVPHASPDLGSAGYGDARESIETRVIAFW